MSDDPTTPAHEDEFDLVFFIVVVGSFVPGMTVRWSPRLLGLEGPRHPTPAGRIDITSSLPVRVAQLSLFIASDSPIAGPTVSELALPDDDAVMLIVRNEQLVAPRGHTVLEVGDHACAATKRASTPSAASRSRRAHSDLSASLATRREH